MNKDAKAWLMRQVASTGVLNSKITEPKATNGKQTSINLPPGLLLKNEEGSLTDTSQLKGKVIFINFWASWCPPCRAEFPSIIKLSEKYKSNPNVAILTINLDENTALGKAYLEKEKFALPFLTPANEIPKEFFSGSLPTTVILDKKGEIRFHHEGVADYSKESFYEQIDQLLEE